MQMIVGDDRIRHVAPGADDANAGQTAASWTGQWQAFFDHM
jgi:hypothetical protein